MPTKANSLKKSYRWLSKKPAGNSLDKYFTTIHEITCYYWFEFLRTNDPVWLLKEKSHKVCGAAPKAYKALQDDIINRFGVSQQFQAYLEKKILIERMYCQQIITGDKSTQAAIEVYELELKEMIPAEIDPYANVFHVSKVLPGFSIYKNSLFEYLTAIKKISDGRK
jgi:hypothetical protein